MPRTNALSAETPWRELMTTGEDWQAATHACCAPCW